MFGSVTTMAQDLAIARLFTPKVPITEVMNFKVFGVPTHLAMSNHFLEGS